MKKTKETNNGEKDMSSKTANWEMIEGKPASQCTSTKSTPLSSRRSKCQTGEIPPYYVSLCREWGYFCETMLLPLLPILICFFYYLLWRSSSTSFLIFRRKWSIYSYKFCVSMEGGDGMPPSWTSIIIFLFLLPFSLYCTPLPCHSKASAPSMLYFTLSCFPTLGVEFAL